MDRHIIVENFWNVGFDGDKSLSSEDLGWSDYIMRDAESDYPEYIFRYVVEQVGFNILSYWAKDRNFYPIETEHEPIEVGRILRNPDWDGKVEMQKAGLEACPSTCSPGEVLATFEDPSELWNNLKIDSSPIGDVLANSMIIKLD
jgi:hypothetical protein